MSNTQNHSTVKNCDSCCVYDELRTMLAHRRCPKPALGSDRDLMAHLPSSRQKSRVQGSKTAAERERHLPSVLIARLQSAKDPLEGIPCIQLWALVALSGKMGGS
jgi:hypothetical protein